jgi:NHL repeat-containing protein
VTVLLGAWSPPGFAQAPTWVTSWSSPGMCSPRGIGLTVSGDVVVGSDCLNPHIEQFTSSGTFVASWSGPGLAPGEFISPPNGLCVDGAGNVFTVETDANRVTKFSHTPGASKVWKTAAGPVDIAVDAGGSVYVVEQPTTLVQKFSNTGVFLGTVGAGGPGPGQFESPTGIAVDPQGRILVTDYTRQRVLRFSAAATFELEFDPGTLPVDVAAGPDGNIYVIGFYDDRIRKFSPDGKPLLSFQSPLGLHGMDRIAISPTGAIYVTEEYGNRVTKFQMPAVTPTHSTTFGRIQSLFR